MNRQITLFTLLLCLSCGEIKSDNSARDEDKSTNENVDGTSTDGESEGEDQGTGGNSVNSKFQFTTCDKISVSKSTGGQTATNPTKFSPGEIITGVLDENDPEVSAQFWKIDIPKGEYIMVFEVEKANEQHGNIIFDLEIVNEETKEEKDLMKLNSIGYDARTAERFTAVTDRSILIKFSSNHDIGTYKFGFFAPSMPIPQPRFGDCPTTRTLTLGKKEVFEFNETEAGRRIYFVGELEAGEYTINLKSFTTDNEKSNVGAKITQLAEAADEEKAKTIVNINEISLSEERSGKMLIAKKQIVVLSASTSFSDNGMELEIVKN